jgi:hypothetical protein
VPGRGLAHFAMRFSKLGMARSDVGVARAPGAAERFGNSDDAPGYKETTNRALEAPTSVIGKLLDIVESLDHLHLDRPEGGNM